MARTAEVDEAAARLDELEPGGLAKAANRIWGLLKAKAPAPVPPEEDDEDDDEDDDAAADDANDDDDEDDDDGPPPSMDDAVKDAAPDKPAPPPMPGGDPGGGPGGAPGDDDEDADDPGAAGGGAGGGAAVAPADADEDEDEGAGPPAGDDEDDEDDDEDDEAAAPKPGDAKLRKQVLRRSAENPDFFKSLLEGDDAAEVVRMIDASDVLAFIVQTFSEQIAAAFAEGAAIRKSLGRRLTELEQGQTVTLLALEKSLDQQATLLKSLEGQADLLKAFGDAPLPTPSGLRQVRPQRRAVAPAAVDPVLASQGGGDGRTYDKGRISQALMKGQMSGTLNMSRAGDLMLMLDTADGPSRVASYLSEHFPDLHRQAVG